MLQTLKAATIASKQARIHSILAHNAAKCIVSRHIDGAFLSKHKSSLRQRKVSLTIIRASSSATYERHFHSFIGSDVFKDTTANLGGETISTSLHFAPQRMTQKVISVADAASLVNSKDTVCVSGFVSQGAPEAILESIGQKYEETGSPNKVTLLFGGGPGDWGTRGLNHLAKTSNKESSPPLLKRTVGSHYGQVPLVADLALKEQVQAWTLPLGSISRMIRAQATHSPGHITSVGLGTFVDPNLSGGAVNEAAKNSKFHDDLVSRISLDSEEFLMYKALPIDVAIIRGTTADAQGNITIEEESLLCDQKIIAAAAKNSGGLVIAQVKRLAANGSLPARSVAVPGPLVDCVVVVDKENHDRHHSMSYEERDNPVFTGEIREAEYSSERMPLDIRKIIARRAFYYLQPNTVVNLGIGLPEGVATVSKEEGMLDYVTLTTEAGVFGGNPASGRSFGPSSNASAMIEMNQMFDFYDGGGLDISFLGAAEIGPNGDVNVSRMTKNRLTGPGGFIDISQSTKNIVFVTTLTTKGLEVSIPGDGTLEIQNEGSVKKFVSNVYETTFSGDQAARRGQTVWYVTERAVFRRRADVDILELVEIAPGINLQKDVLDQMDFDPIVSPKLGRMDPRIFMEEKMKVKNEMFGSLEERCVYHESDHTVFLEMFGITIDNEEDIEWLIAGFGSILQPLFDKKGPVNVVINYDGFDIRQDLEMKYSEEVEKFGKKYYKTVQRFAGAAFRRAQLGRQISLMEWDPDELFDKFDVTKNGRLSVRELRDGMASVFNMHLSPTQLAKFCKAGGKDLSSFSKSGEECILGREEFVKAVYEIFKATD